MEYFLQQVINGLSIGGIYTLIALGLTMIFGIMDIVNFAHGEFYMLGAFIGFWIIQLFHIPFFLALPLAMLIVGIISVGIERAIFNPLQDRRILDKLLASVGILFVLQTGALILWGPIPRRITDPLGGKILRMGNMFIPSSRLLGLGLAIVLMIILWIFLQRSKLGKAMRATSQNKTAARIRGINIDKVYMTTFFIGGALAAAAGTTAGAIFTIYPTMGLLPTLKAFAIVILGGMGKVPGAIVGGAIIGIAESLGSAYLMSEYRHAYAFLILIIILLIRPQGIMGGWER